MRKLSRRQFLRVAGLAAGASVVAACAPSAPAPAPAAPAGEAPAEQPAPTAAEAVKLELSIASGVPRFIKADAGFEKMPSQHAVGGGVGVSDGKNPKKPSHIIGGPTIGDLKIDSSNLKVKK